MEKLKMIAERWSKLESDIERWKYVLYHRDEIGLRLDNDATYPTFCGALIPSGIEDLPELKEFDNWMGADQGVFDLLEVLGIEAEGV